MTGIERFGGHPLITQDLFKRHPQMLSTFRRELVKLEITILDEQTRRYLICLKGENTEKSVEFAFKSNNPDFNNFKQALEMELEELGIGLVD